MKTRPADRWEVARELRYQLIKALDLSGINLPALNRVVFDGSRDQQAPPLDEAGDTDDESTAKK